MSRLRKCGIYTQWNFTQPQGKMKLCLSQEMDGTGEQVHPLSEVSQKVKRCMLSLICGI
jgi:hypothetical protein